jgi:hypothetical protein
MNTSKNRSVLDVIQQILPYIPEEETDFINELTKYMNKLWMQPPEVLAEAYYWTPLYFIINKYIKDTDVLWKEKVINIYTAKV